MENRGMMILSYSITIAGICGVFVLIIYVYESLIGRNPEIEEKIQDNKKENECGDIEDPEKKIYLEYKKLKERKRKEWEERKEKEIKFVCSKCKQGIQMNQDIYCYFDQQFCSETCRNQFIQVFFSQFNIKKNNMLH